MAPYTRSPSLGRGKWEEQTFKVIDHPLLQFEASLGYTRLSLNKNKNTKKEEKEQKRRKRLGVLVHTGTLVSEAERSLEANLGYMCVPGQPELHSKLLSHKNKGRGGGEGRQFKFEKLMATAALASGMARSNHFIFFSTSPAGHLLRFWLGLPVVTVLQVGTALPGESMERATGLCSH